MTFEEFFTKKRIDLTLLRRAMPALYEEFRAHYAQMSEKSFDHTKKYWFNRLRKDFLLEVVETPKAEVVKTVTAEGTEAPSTTTTAAKPAGFKPRFKPNVAKPAAGASGEPQQVPEESKPPVPDTKPAGFKPRFKAGMTPPVKKTETEGKPDPEAPATEPPKEVARPLGFKPRFKTGKATDKKDDAT